jgi:hypothetical protein
MVNQTFYLMGSWTPVLFRRELSGQGLYVTNSPSSSVELKKAWSYVSGLPCVLMIWSTRIALLKLLLSSPSSSSSWHSVGPLVDPFRSHISRSFCNGIHWFHLPFGLYLFVILSNLLQDVLFTCCNQFLLYACILSKTGVIRGSDA